MDLLLKLCFLDSILCLTGIWSNQRSHMCFLTQFGSKWPFCSFSYGSNADLVWALNFDDMIDTFTQKLASKNIVFMGTQLTPFLHVR